MKLKKLKKNTIRELVKVKKEAKQAELIHLRREIKKAIREVKRAKNKKSIAVIKTRLAATAAVEISRRMFINNLCTTNFNPGGVVRMTNGDEYITNRR